MQDIASRQWSKRGTVLSLRCAQDGTVVSYLLDINGFEIACHRIFLRKLHLPDDYAVVERANSKEQVLKPEREAGTEPQLRRSTRLGVGE